MVCLGFKTLAAGWKVRMNPLSYGGTPTQSFWQLNYREVYSRQDRRMKLARKFSANCTICIFAKLLSTQMELNPPYPFHP